MQVASVDISQEAGKELDRKYGQGDGAMSVVFFDRSGAAVRRVPRVTEDEARQVLDGLLGTKN